MKLYELDWHEVLGTLPRWEALSPSARRAFLTIKPGNGFDLGSLGKPGAELEQAGLLVAPTGRGFLHALDPDLRSLLIALRAGDRLRPLHGPGGVLRQEYVVDQFDTFQSHRIAQQSRSYYTAQDRKLAADAASSAAWVRGFLTAAESHRKLVKWEDERRPASEKPRLVFPAVAQALRVLVQALAPHPGGVPLSSAVDRVPDAKPASVAAALAAGLRYLLVFVSIDRDANAVVGLLPAVATRLSSTVAPPRPVQARETFSAPYRVGDMTAVLVEAATEPVAMRASDRSLYVRAQRAIAGRLATVPRWVDDFTATGASVLDDEDDDEDDDDLDGEDPDPADAAERVDRAVEFAGLLKLAVVKSSGGRIRLEATRAGRDWLAHGEGERLRHVLSAIRALPQRNLAAYGSSGGMDFFAAATGFQVQDRGLDARAALSAAFLSVAPGGLFAFAEFARYHARENNPFLGPEGPRVRARSYWSGEPTTIEAWEDVWADVLLAFLARRLVPLGGATLGRTEDGAVAFGLTDAGRYLLGAADDFELPAEAGGGDVVVQPDFEIVFLAPAPRAEAELGRIAERTGAGMGALFRLTRASVLRAAEQGMTFDQVTGTLESVSRGGVPANVARQLRDWMHSVRSIRIAPAVLIDCPDAETAGRVKSLGGAHVTTVTPTLLRLDADTKTRTALVKRLRERGIFIAAAGEAAAGTGSPARGGARGRR